MNRISFLINRVASSISGIVVMLLIFATVIDVGGRFLFNHPLPGTIEATELSLVVIVFLAFGYAEYFEEHVVIDTLYEIMPKVVKKVFYLLAGIISLVIIILMAWQLFLYSGRMMKGDYQTAVLGISYAPVVLVACLGSILYALAILSNIIKSFKEDRGESC